MQTEPLFTFTSSVEGRNAEVQVFADRIEWAKKAYLGARSKGSEMVLVKAINSITTEKDGLAHTKVKVICSGNTIDFRLPHAKAAEVKAQLTQLLLGASSPAPAPAPGAPPPPPPGAPVLPAGWHPDPSARHELRYHDGTGWTNHVSDGGVPGTD